MTQIYQTYQHLLRLVAILIFSVFSPVVSAHALTAQVDTFTHKSNNEYDLPRQFIDDSSAGGASTASYTVENGLLLATGKLKPARGQLGWASSILLLSSTGQPMDASQYQGIELRVKLNHGNLSVSANSTLVSNFDYHAAQLKLSADGKFHTVRVPFKEMKPAWSKVTALDPSTLNSISIVAFAFQAEEFSYALDFVKFY